MLGFVQPAVDWVWKHTFDWMRNHPRTLKYLDHVVLPLSNGGHVVVLDNGALIRAEAEAMLQALHSRSVGGFFHHLKEFVKRGAERFMATIYVGYGHKSIGDCGTVTVFIEGVSMLSAKAIQDFMLYCGQESSTRYIDFLRQMFINPLRNRGEGDGPERMLEKWRAFYADHMEEVKAHLREQNPRKEGEKKKDYDKAIGARAFDIMRGFLPAGASTNLAWHSNLRQLADHLTRLRNHPLSEVQEVALVLEQALCTACPSSFAPEKRDPNHYDLNDPVQKEKYEGYRVVERYTQAWMQTAYFLKPGRWPEFQLSRNSIDSEALREFQGLMSSRPPRAELPKIIGTTGTMSFEFLLDFGSFRDIHRHRAVIQRMPFVTWKYGFNPWYLEQLPVPVREAAIELLAEQEGWLNLNEENAGVDIQYYVAMGYQQPCKLSGDLPSLQYLVELRGTRFVHPTLVVVAKKMATTLSKLFYSYGLVLHMDDEPNRFDVRRGQQDIVVGD